MGYDYNIFYLSRQEIANFCQALIFILKMTASF